MTHLPSRSQTYASLLAQLENPDSERWVSSQIREHRQGRMTLRLIDGQGRPAAPVRLRLRQARHEFFFGANLFMLDGHGEESLNRAYEEAFLEVFNSGVVPFYWADLEPEQGKPRFEVDSPPIARRPPPDRVLAFCERHGIAPKGHCLVWHQWVPQWMPADPVVAAPLLERHLREIAARYGSRIGRWDVVNEPLERVQFPAVTHLPREYVQRAFEVAGESFPSGARLFLNEATTFSWREYREETTALSLLVDNLRLRGLRVDGLGLQYHLFFYANGSLTADLEPLVQARETFFDPARLWAVLDDYARLGVPLDISEITLPSFGDGAEGEEFQARLLRVLYRLWFSHPAVEAIHWWNLADGGANGREGLLRGGLLREDLQPKPAYDMLRRLVREEWATRVDDVVEGAWTGPATFGDYEVIVEHKDRTLTRSLTFSRTGPREIVLSLEPGRDARPAGPTEPLGALSACS